MKKAKKSDIERVLEAVEKMLLKEEKESLARAKQAARKGWYVQAALDDASAHVARHLYSQNMYHLRVQFGCRRGGQ